MPIATLPPHLISLIQHVELNKADWLGAATKRFILTAIWATGKPLDTAEISQQLSERFSLSVSAETIAPHAESLVSSGVLVRVPGGRHFKIPEQTLNQLSADLQAATEIQDDVKARFSELVERTCPSLSPEQVWDHFSAEFLLPLVREMGARTYELLSGYAGEVARTGTLAHFLSRYGGSETKQGLEEAVIAFLDPKVPSVRAYILRHLNAFFLLEATSLADSTLAAISDLTQVRPGFTVFADTNFLFSVLALHDNPANDAAIALLNLTKHLAGSVNMKFYVTALTLDETRRVIVYYRDALRNVHITPNMAESVKRGTLSGIGLKFSQECIRLKRSLDADDYFGPYINNLLEILRSKGIELYNENLDAYRLSQPVIDDVLAQLESEKQRFGERAKTYEQLLHDVVLWHFVKNKRTARVESIVNAKFWVTTLDFRLLSFDRYKRTSVSEIGICIHPTALVQVLQFWVPRTQEFEEAIVASIRYPLFFYQFDPAAERTTIRIIEAVSRFEGVGDLPADTIARIFVDRALRGKVGSEGDSEKRVELVKDAVIQYGVEVKEELESARRRIEELEAALAGKSNEIEELDRAVRTKATGLADLERVAVTAQDAMLEARRGTEEERKQREALARRMEELEAGIIRRASEDRDARARRRFVTAWGLGALPALLVVAVSTTLVMAILGRRGLLSRWAFWSGSIVVWTGLLAFWAGLVDRYGSRVQAVRDTDLFVRFQRIKVWLLGTLAAVVLGAIGNGVWKWIEQMP